MTQKVRPMGQKVDPLTRGMRPMRRGADGFPQKIAVFDQNHLVLTFSGNQPVANRLEMADVAMHPNCGDAGVSPVQPFPLQTDSTVVR